MCSNRFSDPIHIHGIVEKLQAFALGCISASRLDSLGQVRIDRERGLPDPLSAGAIREKRKVSLIHLYSFKAGRK